jgi:hypothetical protein
VRVVKQRHDWDCGAAALASLSGLPYRQIIAMTDVIDYKHQGLYNRELVDVARQIGLHLVPTRSFDLQSDGGILRLRWKERSARGKASPEGHFTVLCDGMIGDPHDGSVTPWREYVLRHGARFGTLLERVDYLSDAF